MKLYVIKGITEFISAAMILWSCQGNTEETFEKPTQNLLVGTWRLIRGTVVEKGDTITTDYTGNISFIKIINETHFAFLQHDTNKGKGTTAVFASGGGSYSFRDGLYTELLEYCSDRQWEGNEFIFTTTIKNDTLIQRGVEKVNSAAVNRMNTEVYVRVK